MKLNRQYRQWCLWLAWIATIYHFFMPFTPVIESVYFTPATEQHEMMMGDMHHHSMMHMMSMGDDHHSQPMMDGKCPNCILGIHFYVQEQFFIPQPLVTLNKLIIAVVVFKEMALSSWNIISPTSRDPPVSFFV